MDPRAEDTDIACDSEDSLLEKELLPPDDMDHDRPSQWKKDDAYYLEDGSCVLLVKDVLFNVHRSVLSKDGSMFSTMFSSRGKGHALGLPNEGRSDDSPIPLQDDTPDEFRDFLWALYALPHELRAVTSPSANLGQLINIARISNKYAFKSVETWALEAIQDYVNRKPSPILSAIPNPSTYTYQGTETSREGDSTIHLTRLISLAQLCGHAPLLNTLINFLRELMSTSLHYAYLAMTLADELDLKSLRGAAYLEVMQKAVIVKPVNINLGLRAPSPSTTVSPPGFSMIHNSLATTQVSLSATHTAHLVGAMANAIAPLTTLGGTIAPVVAPAAALGGGPISATGMTPVATPSPNTETPQVPLPITPTQQLRLLTGYYRLSATWEQLRLSPPHFDHAASCAATWHQHGCTQAWLDFWKEKTRSDQVLALGPADVLGRVRLVQREYDRWGSATYMHHDCRVSARRALSEVVRKVEEGLGDYFGEAGL